MAETTIAMENLRSQVAMKGAFASLKSKLMTGGLVAIGGTSIIGTVSANNSLDLSFLGGLATSVTAIIPDFSSLLDVGAPFLIKLVIVLGIVYFVAKHAGVKL